jgi:uncharacterized membrane protein
MIDCASIPLFAQLPPAEATALSSLLTTRTVQAHCPIFWIGDSGSEFFVVQKGEVVLLYQDEAGREIILGVLGPGEFFGEISLLDGGPRTASARARTEVTLLSLGREQFHEFLRSHPAAAIHIITVIGQRQREMVGRLRGIKNVNEVMEERATLWHRVADAIAGISASRFFFLSHVLWFAIWIVVNVVLGARGFDPFPFGLLTLVVSLEAIFLSIFVLISQNRQAMKDHIGADLDYQVNLKAHLEVMVLHQKMDRMLGMLASESRPGRDGTGRMIREPDR